MRTLNSSGRFSPNEWLLPETSRLFEQQSDRQCVHMDFIVREFVSGVVAHIS